MEHTQALLRLCCLGFGAAMEVLVPDTMARNLFPRPPEAGIRWIRLMLGMTKTVVGCAVTAVAVPLPVSASVLYAGFGILAVYSLVRPYREEMMLSVICTWLILFLPFTGVLACLGGGLLVLAAEVPGLAGVSILVLGAPMALLQFGAEGGLVLLGAAALLFARKLGEWKARKTGLYSG